MARSIDTIYNIIVAEKETQSTLMDLQPSPENASNFLNDLTSDSKVAIWRLWAYITAVAIHTHEVVMDLFKIEVDRIAASAPAGTPRWYQKKMFEFQYQDTLVYKNNQYQYDTIDAEKKIITRCAIEERLNGVVVVKLAKGTDQPEPLSVEERDGANSYAHKIKFAGTRLAVVSIPPDQLNVVYDIYYDPVYPLDDVVRYVDEAVNDHLKNLPFNAALNITSLTDSIQKATGVVDPVFLSGSSKPDALDPINFDVEIIPAAGWFILADDIKNMMNFIQKL